MTSWLAANEPFAMRAARSWLAVPGPLNRRDELPVRLPKTKDVERIVHLYNGSRTGTEALRRQ